MTSGVAPCTFSVESIFLLFFSYLLRFFPLAQLQDYSVQVGGLGSFQLSEQQLMIMCKGHI